MTEAADDCELCRARAHGKARPRVGRAFEPCWRCGRNTPRPGTTEWDFHTPRDRRAIALRRVTFALLGGLVLPAAYVVAVATGARAWSALDAVIALGTGWVLVGCWAGFEHALEVRRSRRRVATDPMYRMRLVERGIAASRTSAPPAEPAGNA